MKKFFLNLCVFLMFSFSGCQITQYYYVEKYVKGPGEYQGCKAFIIEFSEKYEMTNALIVYVEVSLRKNTFYPPPFYISRNNQDGVVEFQCDKLNILDTLDENSKHLMLCECVKLDLHFENYASDFYIHSKKYYCKYDSLGVSQVNIRYSIRSRNFNQDGDKFQEYIDDDKPVFIDVHVNIPPKISGEKEDYTCSYYAKFEREYRSRPYNVLMGH